MKVDEDVYLKHYGKKGMRWGQKNKAQKKKLSRNQKLAIGATAAVGAAFVAGNIMGKSGRIPTKDAINMTNKASGKLVTSIGHQFVKNSIDKKVVLNYGRQISEGLINITS